MFYRLCVSLFLCLVAFSLAAEAIAEPIAIHGVNAADMHRDHTEHGGAHHQLIAARIGGNDQDADGREDFADNCLMIANADQRDTDADGYGNACDADLDNNNVINFLDLGRLRLAFFGTPGAANWNPDADFNGDDVVNFIDLGVLRLAFFQPPGPSGLGCAGSAPCPQEQLEFAWPFNGVDGLDWVINNYVDLDAGPGVLDYQGGAKSYDGHRGVDINVPTFRSMDADVPVLAVADGVVLATDDAHFDRNRTCSGNWNFVTVGHANGWKTIYGHLKRNSIVVSVGDAVSAGTELGVVGSSGCSTHPHLHLETLDENNNVIEPFAEQMWVAPPVYDTPVSLMDYVVMPNRFDSVGNVADPTPNATFVEAGGPIGVAVTVAGGMNGSNIKIRLTENGANLGEGVINFTQTYRHTFWYLHFQTGGDWAGDYQVEIRVDDVLVATHDVTVRANLTGFYQVHYAVADSTYQSLFEALVSQGYRLTSIDGYSVMGQTYFNALFDFSPMSTWASAHNQSAAEYQAFYDAQVDAGRRLVHVDSYLLNGNVVYASIFVQQGGAPWAAYHGVDQATHDAQFNALVNAGYRAIQISVVQNAQGQMEYTARYDRAAVGSWLALSNLTSAEYSAEFNAQLNAGRYLTYLNGYQRDGTARFSAIWDSVPHVFAAGHDLTEFPFSNVLDSWMQQGLKTRLITGYENEGAHNLAGLWTD